MSEKGQGDEGVLPGAGGGGDGGSSGGGGGNEPPIVDPVPVGGGGGGAAAPPDREPLGELEFEDGSRLKRDANGDWTYTDPSGRSGRWQGGSDWVDPATGEPMPSDFRPKTPGDRVPYQG